MRLDQLKISAAGSRLRCRLYRGALKREPAQCGEVEGKQSKTAMAAAVTVLAVAEISRRLIRLSRAS
jgi:hypothetical protein